MLWANICSACQRGRRVGCKVGRRDVASGWGDSEWVAGEGGSCSTKSIWHNSRVMKYWVVHLRLGRQSDWGQELFKFHWLSTSAAFCQFLPTSWLHLDTIFPGFWLSFNEYFQVMYLRIVLLAQIVNKPSLPRLTNQSPFLCYWKSISSGIWLWQFELSGILEALEVIQDNNHSQRL